ncbi:N-acetyl-gamma-glutamyl-phosphate reductase [Labilibaculum euxinus]|uniref:N-acetyl-gamma-glutamyl-phosphate reductase n=1 Tax=Labilibaculum euxinus TaxID=2686357 RepID=A0A7M4D4L5_9BACT|nr:N-acetyl-gamma-glutamyl-phosphate reductase [Labilibaculum euxinus]MUP37594.1 N-acetyl-gamma-glutamyl-phosphate reductase [Labilibaculum euxinus]MVB06799.1 N-acetyl-gamma-glutamyl-phosphate reductase [Labilibaculum euxinus]
MVNVGIIGGAGYTAGELLRILIWHPQANISFVQSTSHMGHPVSDVHRDLFGDTDLSFSEADYKAIDVLFICSGHGKTKLFLKENNLPEAVKIIDLSTDFRPKANEKGFVYGLPEINKAKIANADKIANPGCFATCIELGLLPLANESKLKEEVHVTAITGSTGAGQNPTSTSHFSWKNNNVSVYKAFTHQHLAEITETVLQLQPNFDKEINFIPVRGNFSRGIMATIYTDCDWSAEEAVEKYKTYYKNHPFVSISNISPDVKQVVNTNKCVLYLEKHGSKLMIISVIDNLLKGASGQAVQNMNLLFGMPEILGLGLKPVGF